VNELDVIKPSHVVEAHSNSTSKNVRTTLQNDTKLKKMPLVESFNSNPASHSIQKAVVHSNALNSSAALQVATMNYSAPVERQRPNVEVNMNRSFIYTFYFSNNCVYHLTIRLLRELDDIHNSIKTWLSKPPTEMPINVTIQSLRARRDRVEEEIMELRAQQLNQTILPVVNLPDSSVTEQANDDSDEISDEIYLEALRQCEEREAASSAAKSQISYNNELNSNSSLARAQLFPSSPSPIVSLNGLSVVKNGAVYHSAAPSTSSFYDENSAAASALYMNSSDRNYSSRDGINTNNMHSNDRNYSSRDGIDTNNTNSIIPQYSTDPLYPSHEITSNRSFDYNNPNLNSMPTGISCLCGLPCPLLTSRQANSLGCTFYSCPKDKSTADNCGFFKWEQGPDSFASTEVVEFRYLHYFGRFNALLSVV